jgi:glutathione S-transferase
MITLHVFGPQFGLPDPSPFVHKAEVLLKLSGVPFKVCTGDLRRAPKGKMPFIEEDGKLMGDSTLIRLHLEQKHGVDFDKSLTSLQKGTAWAVEKMLEDNLYWAVVNERWLNDENFDKGPRRFFDAVPAMIRPIIVPMVRRTVRKNLHAHGLGRHTNAEIVALASRAIEATANVLGDNTYLMGTQKCGADATVYAFIASVLTPFFKSELRPVAQRFPNLVAYCDRMQREFYPNLGAQAVA